MLSRIPISPQNANKIPMSYSSSFLDFELEFGFTCGKIKDQHNPEKQANTKQKANT